MRLQGDRIWSGEGGALKPYVRQALMRKGKREGELGLKGGCRAEVYGKAALVASIGSPAWENHRIKRMGQEKDGQGIPLVYRRKGEVQQKVSRNGRYGVADVCPGKKEHRK